MNQEEAVLELLYKKRNEDIVFSGTELGAYLGCKRFVVDLRALEKEGWIEWVQDSTGKWGWKRRRDIL